MSPTHWRRLWLTLAIMWAALILFFSLMPNRPIRSPQSLRDASSNINYTITNQTRKRFHRGLQTLTQSETRLKYWKRQLPVDGLLHAAVAALLCALLWLATRKLWLASLIALAHSGFTEVLQHYIPYRSSEWSDVKFPLLVLSGWCAFVWLYRLLRYVIQRKQATSAAP